MTQNPSQLTTGLLLRGVSSFYDIQTQDGILRCRARGRLRLDGTEPLAGDTVSWEPDPAHPGFGIVTGILPRKNNFIRPNVANVDLMVFVASSARPVTDPFLIDRLSVVAAAAKDCRFLVCLNKCDLDSADALFETYSACGIPVLRCSALTGEGIGDLLDHLAGKRNSPDTRETAPSENTVGTEVTTSPRITVFTGNSGVGKTSLLNLLIPGLDGKTAEISLRHGRGKHTTRHTQLFPLLPEACGMRHQTLSGAPSVWIADTPGFAALELSMLSDIRPEELAACFPEFPPEGCRFPDCLHHHEPGCAVTDAVRAGNIAESRYSSYLRMLQDLQTAEKSR